MSFLKLNISLFRIRVVQSKTSVSNHFKYYSNRKIDTVAKRGSMLEEFVANKDKRKHWYLNLQETKPKVRVFDKVHKPHRRRNVLNSLFIKNITDVLSTGEIIPELANYGIEITGVQTSPCCKILNVFWQVPMSKYDSCEDIGKLLNIAAPKIRAELISRNVIGRVPFIFFLRDCTNKRVSEFEEAMKRLDAEPKEDSSVIVDDLFLEDIYSFKESKIQKKNSVQTVKAKTTKEDAMPQTPLDMKCDVFGIDHKVMMEKVIAIKKKRRSPPVHSAVVYPEMMKNEDDLFSKIPGVCFHANTRNSPESRELILKKFHIERKMLRQQIKDKDQDVNVDNYECEYNIDDSESFSFNSINDDFVEEETTDNYK